MEGKMSRKSSVISILFIFLLIIAVVVKAGIWIIVSTGKQTKLVTIFKRSSLSSFTPKSSDFPLVPDKTAF